ncbi:MAG TPA: uracil-DNA glycosylase [Candidatus Magasanikbacteria bacterium]|nr:uracil-DNA glycosylase [Candidatus Magasanikbacteria bacterium]
MSKKIDIEPEWKEVLSGYFETDSFARLTDFVRGEYCTKSIFPKPRDVFHAFWLTPFSDVKVVILGQDPYHGIGQAHGLCFSVPKGVPVPPSLVNIYKEIEKDLNIKKDYANGNLENWGQQGVFLLNAILTVIAHTPASHRGRGWEEFTDTVIKTISDKRDHVVFMLWGNYARGKKVLIDAEKHLVLEAPHPSPLSAYAGFLGCRHFSKCNEFLKSKNIGEIKW